MALEFYNDSFISVQADSQEAVVSITLGYHKAIILLLLRYQCVNHYTYKREFLFHVIF